MQFHGADQDSGHYADLRQHLESSFIVSSHLAVC